MRLDRFIILEWMQIFALSFSLSAIHAKDKLILRLNLHLKAFNAGVQRHVCVAAMEATYFVLQRAIDHDSGAIGAERNIA